MYDVDARIEHVAQLHQALWGGRQHPDEGLVHAEEDGHLNDQGTQAPHRADPEFLVKPHGFLRHALAVLAVALAQVLNARLDFAHCLGLAYLTERKRQGKEVNNDRERDDGQAEVLEQIGV